MWHRAVLWPGAGDKYEGGTPLFGEVMVKDVVMGRVIGVTGGIATGKSTVMNIFARLGARTLSADAVAREVLAKGGICYQQTIQRFGEEIVGIDGEIDRATLGGIIFSDPSARQDLENITHPHIIAQINRQIEEFRADSANVDHVLAVEIPLLVECGLESVVDDVVVVAAELETQVCRLTTIRGISSDEAELRIKAQMPLDMKIERADWVIWNDGSLESLESQVRAVWDEIRLP